MSKYTGGFEGHIDDISMQTNIYFFNQASTELAEMCKIKVLLFLQNIIILANQ